MTVVSSSLHYQVDSTSHDPTEPTDGCSLSNQACCEFLPR